MPHIVLLNNDGCVPKADDLLLHVLLSDVDGDEDSCSNQSNNVWSSILGTESESQSYNTVPPSIPP